MNMNRILQNLCTLAASLLILAACTQDNLTDTSQGEPLPEGKYPMTFATTVEGVTATRATTDGSWTGDEAVAMQIGEEVKKYKASNAGVLSIATGITPWYWKNTTEEKTVSAWYPYSDTKPTTFSVKEDQSGQSGTDGYQASDLIYAASQKVAYSGNRKLTFKHLPVKVVVNLKAGNGVTANEVTSATVSIINQSLTSGAITEETTSTDATTGGTNTADWSVAQVTSGDIDITPKAVTPAATDCQKSVQALLVPRQMKGVSFIKVTAGGNNYYYIPEKETDANLQAGQQYTYTITVTKNGLTVTASGAADWTGTEKDPVASKEVAKGFTASDLKVGDYFYSDGTWSDGGYRKYSDKTTATLPIMPVLTDANGKARTVIGIIYSTDASRIGNAAKEALKQKGVTTPHGLVMALTNASEQCQWGEYGRDENNDGTGPFQSNTSTLQAQYNNVDGYGETHWILDNYKDNSTTLMGTYSAFYHASRYGATEGETFQYAAPVNTTTGWFIPSMGQWWDILSNLGGINLTNYCESGSFYASIPNKAETAVGNMNRYLEKIDGATKFSIDTFFWSSSEFSSYGACSVRFYSDGDLYLYDYGKGDSYRKVRCVFAF